VGQVLPGQLCDSQVVLAWQLPPEQEYVVTLRLCVPGPQFVYTSQALQAPYSVAGQVTVGMLQPCVSVQVEGKHEPPEHEYAVTVRDCVPEPPQALALQALQPPYWVAGQLTVGMLQLCVCVQEDAWHEPPEHP